MPSKTFKVMSPQMEGDAIEEWQKLLLSHMRAWGWHNVPLKVDGRYGPVTRSFTSLVLRGHGIAQEELEHGVTPDLRIKVRNKRLSADELRRKAMRMGWRVQMRDSFATKKVHVPVRHVITDSHGFSAGHDGIDIICPPFEPLHAICNGVIRRVSDDWWGLGNPGGALGDRGDGIIMLESTTDAGPFRKGLMFGYGHAEGPKVKEGDRVKAGQIIGRAGFANAWHPHFMVNDGRQKLPDGRPKGVGTTDPRPFLTYAKKHG